MDKHIPAGSMMLVRGWFSTDPVVLRIHSPRSTKLGDFRPAWKGKPQSISVNSGLHRVEFLITLAHEFAHAENYRINGRRVKPHGPEWKGTFRRKLLEIMESGILDSKYIEAIRICYFGKSGFKQNCDTLRRIYDREKSGLKTIRLEDIPEGSEFISGGKTFVKGPRRRTRYECREKGTGRFYTVHKMAEIKEFKTP